VIPTFPDRLAPPVTDGARVTALVALANQIESRDHHAIREMFDQTGRVVAWLDVRSAAGSTGIEPFVERLLLPEVLERPGLTDEEALQLLDLVESASLRPALHHYALDLLTVELDQPYLTDLIYWPGPDAPGDGSALLALARSTKGDALQRYLDPMCSPKAPGVLTLPSRSVLAAVRPVLVAMAEAGEVELQSGERAAAWLALGLADMRTGADLAARMCADASGIEEVFADDETLAPRLEAMTGR